MVLNGSKPPAVRIDQPFQLTYLKVSGTWGKAIFRRMPFLLPQTTLSLHWSYPRDLLCIGNAKNGDRRVQVFSVMT